MRFWLAAVLFATWLTPAMAATARQLYIAGKFDEAERAALLQRTAAGFALAARSELAAETMRQEPCLACLRRAEDFALRAIQADPRLVEGHIEYVIAIGYESRLIGMIQAHFQGYAEKARQHIDASRIVGLVLLVIGVVLVVRR